MLHAVRGVPFALVAAEAAGGRARLERGGNRLRLERRLARDDAADRVAQIGAIEVEPDAEDQIVDGLLAEAGIRTRGAGLGAVEAGADAGDQRVVVKGRSGVGFGSWLGRSSSGNLRTRCK
jgi:hypothetical protein